MAESARCLACTYSPITREHQCVRYTFPHGTYRCGCVCQKPESHPPTGHRFSHEDGFLDHCECGWSGTSHPDHVTDAPR